MICYAKATIAVPIAEIRQEVEKLADSGWSAHVNTRVYDGEWTALPLRSPGGGVENTVAQLMGIHNAYIDTPLMDECQTIKKLLGSLNCEILSARLLNLKKGAVIRPHRDKELSFEHGEARLHFPVFTNPEVAFYVEDDKLDMLPGECWYINANLTHSVSNNGETDRIHLVIDCIVNEWLCDLMNNAEKKSVNPPPDTRDWDKIIPALRQMGTATALATANDMENQLKAIDSR